ncbi:CoxG family protein [Nitratireductor luteus]|uniref:CoxG family protein n=1 Tax=Nitratireductor luteus TaxID=2976980 RepID=UPI00223FF796|nr:carbon monoxide dehydrogenase subunit G [Nitratireductor luteus]
MKLEGEFVVPLSRQEVWTMLNDPEVLQRAIPGCKELTETDDGYSAKVGVAIGPVKATFSGDVTFTDVTEFHGYTLMGQGSGGVAGFAKGSAKMLLEEREEGTAILYDVDASVAGKLAQLGNRLIASTSKKLAAQFFDELNVIAQERAAA